MTESVYHTDKTEDDFVRDAFINVGKGDKKGFLMTKANTWRIENGERKEEPHIVVKLIGLPFVILSAKYFIRKIVANFRDEILKELENPSDNATANNPDLKPGFYGKLCRTEEAHTPQRPQEDPK